MEVLKKTRELKGFSQRTLAQRAGVSFRCVQQLEEPDHNWRVESMRRIGNALMLPEGGLRYYCERYLSLTQDSIEDISLRIYSEGVDSWRVHLFDFVDRFRRTRARQLIKHPPISDLPPRIQSLIASTVEVLCDECGQSPPAWCRGIIALDRPWFVSGVENLKAMSLVESPVAFRSRNIFVLGNFMDRV